MANVSMICHPLTPAFRARGVDVTYHVVSGGILQLRYDVACDRDSLHLPVHDASGDRADGLWQTSCFELFLRKPGKNSYLEFNFSPSSRWAAYHFSGYREGMAEWTISRPEIRLATSDRGVTLEVALLLPDLLDTPCEIGLSAVLHETNDTKSYWALAHPSGNPDFHHPDCFALNLAAPAST